MKLQKGFGVVEILIALAVVVGVGAVGWYVWQAQQAKSSTNSSNSSSSSSANSNQSTAYDNACEVVTKTEVEAAFGSPFGDWESKETSTNINGLPVSSCTIQQQNDGSVEGLSSAINFSIQLENYDSPEAAHASLEATSNSAELGGKVYFVKTDAPNIGDEAFFFQGQSDIVLETEEFMYARKGSQVFHFVAVRLDGIDHAAAKTQLTQLAQIALN